ncbi:MAG: Bax inhibitor-1/YccA family protein [Candidatus Acidiferrales bacterium]
MPNLMRTSNPALNPKAFEGAITGGEVMTLQGTVNKTGLLLVCAVLTAVWTWSRFMHAGMDAVALPVMGGLVAGFIVAMVTIFKKEWSPVTAPIYALLEGFVLGGVSAAFEVRFPGIAIEAVSLTFGTLIVLLLAYRSGLIPVTQKFRLGVVAATGGIALIYLLTMVLGFFHVQLFSSIYQSGAIGIGFSVFVVIIAALNLVLDFDFIEAGARMGAPKYMEWYSAFGLMVTLIWLYLEILRLLSKLGSRR